MCQGNGEVTAAHPFCVILQKDRLYFKGTDRGTDRAVFLDKREFTGPIYYASIILVKSQGPAYIIAN